MQQQDLFTYKDRVLSPNEVKKFYEEAVEAYQYKSINSLSATITDIVRKNINNPIFKDLPKPKRGRGAYRELTLKAKEEIQKELCKRYSGTKESFSAFLGEKKNTIEEDVKEFILNRVKDCSVNELLEMIKNK